MHELGNEVRRTARWHLLHMQHALLIHSAGGRFGALTCERTCECAWERVLPQHTTRPRFASTPHVCVQPADTALNRNTGGPACFSTFRPQQTAAPLTCSTTYSRAPLSDTVSLKRGHACFVWVFQAGARAGTRTGMRGAREHTRSSNRSAGGRGRMQEPGLGRSS